jgi:gamma-glutamyl phosphate reductase
MDTYTIAKTARSSAQSLASSSSAARDEALQAIYDKLVEEKEVVLEANRRDKTNAATNKVSDQLLKVDVTHHSMPQRKASSPPHHRISHVHQSIV